MIEVPVIFIVLMAIAVIAGFATAFEVHTNMRSKVRAAERAAVTSVQNTAYLTQRPHLVSDKKHGLHKCWYESSRWRWKCECGVGASVPNITDSKGEAIAIKNWRVHVEVHERLVLPTNELSHQECDARFVGLWSLFEKYRTACYCQTTSNDLIMLNQEAKKFKPAKKEIEKVSE